jgi:hypothetical protein
MAMPEAVLEPRFDGIGLHHSAAQAGIEELMADLRQVPDLMAREEASATAGLKGVTQELIVTLGASGTIAGLARILNLWLNRDRRRSLNVRLRSGDRDTVISIDGDQISTQTLARALETAVDLSKDA